MSFTWIVDQGAGNTVLVAEGFEPGAVVHKVVLSAANHPKEGVLRLCLFNVRNKGLGHIGVWCGRETSYKRENIHIGKSEIEGLATAH